MPATALAIDIAKHPASYMPALDRPVHPVCAMFPMLAGDAPAFRDLVASIEEYGLLEPIVVDGDAIVDGRHRYIGCVKAAVEPRFVQFTTLGLGCDAATYAHEKNIARRDLTPDQRAAITVKYDAYLRDVHAAANARRKEAANDRRKPDGTLGEKPVGENSPRQVNDAGRAREDLQQKANVSEHKARQALAVAQAAPELLDDVASGETSLKDAAKKAATRKTTQPATNKPRPYDLERVTDGINKYLRKKFDACPQDNRRTLKRRIREIADDL